MCISNSDRKYVIKYWRNRIEEVLWETDWCDLVGKRSASEAHIVKNSEASKEIEKTNVSTNIV